MGSIDNALLVKYYRQASIFVLPTLVEAFGVVLLEALSCGTPVISTYTGGIPEVVKSGENAILVPVNDSVKLADAIEYLLENEYVRDRFAEAGRRWVLNNFSPETSVSRLFNIYQKISKK